MIIPVEPQRGEQHKFTSYALISGTCSQLKTTIVVNDVYIITAKHVTSQSQFNNTGRGSTL